MGILKLCTTLAQLLLKVERLMNRISVEMEITVWNKQNPRETAELYNRNKLQ